MPWDDIWKQEDTGWKVKFKFFLYCAWQQWAELSAEIGLWHMGHRKNDLRHQKPKTGEWGWWETEAWLAGLGPQVLLSFCNGGAEEKCPKYCIPMMLFTCPEEQTSSPATPEKQLGITELQRTVKHCPGGLTMQPGSWPGTGQRSSSAGKRSLGRSLCWASLCSAAKPCLPWWALGRAATWWPR